MPRALWTLRLPSYPIALALLDSARSLGVVGGIEGECCLIDFHEGRLMRKITAHGGGLTSLCAFPNHELRFATGGEDGLLRVWTTEQGEPLEEYRLGGGWVEAVASNEDGVLAAGGGRQLRVWGRERDLLIERELDSSIRHLLFVHPAGELIALTAGAIYFLALPRGEIVREVPLNASAYVAQLSGDSRWLACGMSDMSVRLMDVTTPEEEAFSIGPLRFKPRALSWSQDGSHLAIANGDEPYLLDQKQWVALVRNSDPEAEPEKQPLRRLDYVVGRVCSMAFHPTRELLAIGTREGNLVVQDITSNQRLLDAQFDEEEIAHVMWGSHGDRLVYALADGTAGCFEIVS